ncbi:GNAT family protein [Streptomyces sp. NPDC049577]|uniref:GNAT family N-acetyltransferase n=1 Tax=Streptomyces sp. NPDC049577 TaxID=3155153 RepID=UPI003445E0AC
MFFSSSPNGADLTTDRLVLRRWPAGELDAVLDGSRLPHWADDFPADGDREIAGYLATLTDPGHLAGQRQLVERGSGLVIGSAGLFWPPADGTVEFGYGIVPSRRGRGYATEAARALVTLGFTAPGVHTVGATVDLSNPASIRVLEKAGLERWATEESTARFRATAPGLS